MPEVTAAHLDNDQIDALLERFDATDPVLQRRIVVQLCANLYKAEEHKANLLAACKEVAARLHDQANEMICQNLMAESDFLREMRDLLLLAARNAENSPDCS